MGSRRALWIVEVTRSLLSLTAVSGNPTAAILSAFRQPACTSISTSNASTPKTAAEQIFESITFVDRVLVVFDFQVFCFLGRLGLRKL